MSTNKPAAVATGADEPFRCPVCSGTVTFTLLLAHVRGLHFQQVRAHAWRAERPMPKRFDYTVPLGVVCDACGHTTAVPASIVAEAIKPAARRRW